MRTSYIWINLTKITELKLQNAVRGQKTWIWEPSFLELQADSEIYTGHRGPHPARGPGRTATSEGAGRFTSRFTARLRCVRQCGPAERRRVQNQIPCSWSTDGARRAASVGRGVFSTVTPGPWAGGGHGDRQPRPAPRRQLSFEPAQRLEGNLIEMFESCHQK